MLILLHGEHILKLNFDNDVIKICIIDWFFSCFTVGVQLAA